MKRRESMGNVIEVKNAKKEFKNQIVLDDVTVSFEKNKIHGIIGRNGSGKTVLFKCICGFMPLTEGEIIVKGKVIGKEVDVPEKTGIIIEAPGFLPNYSGYKNLKFLAAVHNKIDKCTIYESMERVGLDPKNKKHVSKYSLGMRQRLGIAQAIMEQPELLILDEPMNGLDNDGVEDIRKILLQLKSEGKTIILASHNKEDISVLCDTVHVMDKGVVQKNG
jgi:ABC-2 type transport system ATP-binding protein